MILAVLFSPTEPFVSDDSLRLAQRLQFGPDRRLHLGAVAHEAPQGLDPALARSALPLVTFQGHWTVRATLPWFYSEGPRESRMWGFYLGHDPASGVTHHSGDWPDGGPYHGQGRTLDQGT